MNADIMTKEIHKRFFEAIEYARSSGKIRGLGTFCRKHGLNATKYKCVRLQVSDPEPKAYNTYKGIDVAALAFLCEDYNISPEWLLLGKGKMLRS